MNIAMIAPCGVNCELCLGYQREKNKCVGCNKDGNKPNHCRVCSIKDCPEKNGNNQLLCNNCTKFPCRRIKDLDKRYKTKYGESIIENFSSISEIGLDEFVRLEAIKWACPQCGKLLCVHRESCLHCGNVNDKFPR